MALVDGATLDKRRDWDGSEGWKTATCTARGHCVLGVAVKGLATWLVKI